MGTNHSFHPRTWLIIAALAAGCAPVNTQVQTAADTSSTLQLVASTTTIGFNSSLTVTASGGTPPYSFSLGGGGTSDADGSIVQTSNTTAQFTSLTVAATGIQLAVTDSTGTPAYSPDLTISSTSGSTGTGLTVIVGTGGTNSTTITTSQTATIVVTGGSGNYNYSVQGPGTVSGQTFIPSGEGTATITVNDTIDTSYSGICTVIITEAGSSSSGGLSVNPSSPSTEAGQGVQITPGGGTGPYLFGVVSGGGTFSTTSVTQGNSTTYYPPGGAEAGSQLELSVEDQSDGNIVDFWVTITSGAGVPSSSPISWSSSSFVIDNDFAITFDNTGDVPGYTGNPAFWIWGSGPGDDAADVGKNGGTLDTIVLSNYDNAAGAPTAYEGTFAVQGRSASTTIYYCIPPSTNGNSMVAYISQSGGPNGHFNNPIASYGGNVASGYSLYAYFVTVDGSPFSGAGNASVSFTGAFTAYSDCTNIPGYSQNEFVEVVN